MGLTANKSKDSFIEKNRIIDQELFAYALGGENIDQN